MPRIRDAMRSRGRPRVLRLLPGAGEPDLLAGREARDSAAPPRASPSSLVRDHAVEADPGTKSLPTFTASWPVMASRRGTSRHFHRRLQALQLVHELGVDVQAACGVQMTTS